MGDFFLLIILLILPTEFLFKLKLGNSPFQQINFFFLFLCCFILLLLALISSPHKQFQTFWVALPPCGGDLDGEVGGREEREDLGGDVVAAVVHALAE